MVMQRQDVQGIAEIRQGLALWQAMGAENVQPYFLALLAEAHGAVGQPQDGLLILAEALAKGEQIQEKVWEAELYRLKGELTLQARDKNREASVIEAESCFHRALDVSRNQAAKSWELRAATSLARLWQQQGKTGDARNLLAPVYNWFTEGFDTPDLKDAKALLDSVSEGE
jgi:predicted ATPase